MYERYQLYFGGPIYTVDDHRPQVEAVAVADGRILATGSLEKCRAAMGRPYHSIDLVILKDYPGAVPTDQIKNIRVERTICTGKEIYKA